MNPASLAIESLASGEQLAELQTTVADAADFLSRARSKNTIRAYSKDWVRFESWVRGHGLEPMPADPRMVALWLSHLARRRGLKASSVKRALAAIAFAHRAAGHETPTRSLIVREEMRGIENALGARPKQAAPILIGHLEAMLQEAPSDLRGLRDRAVLLVGWLAALRRSELVALTVADLGFSERGVTVTIMQSKTDQSGKSDVVPLFFAKRRAICPVHSLQEWLSEARIENGPVFVRILRNGQLSPGGKPIAAKTVSRIVQRWTTRSELQPEQLGAAFTAHSLRAGFVTEAARAGSPEWAICRQSRHKDSRTVQGYIRIANVFENSAAEGLL